MRDMPVPRGTVLLGTYLGEERGATSDGALLKGVRRKETVSL
ncbi:hypothetical protein ACR6HW_11090 [Fusibacter sp. JL298sf-3]